MANIVIFHSVLGIREGITEMAKVLRKAGHKVYMADLYNGKRFDAMDEAFTYFEKLGIPEIMNRSIEYTKEFPADSFYLGFSNGGASALLLAGSKPGAKGCILFHAALPVNELGISIWPVDVPVEVHYAQSDSWKEEESLLELETNIKDAGAHYRYYEYPVTGHLFTDPGLPEYNEKATNLLHHRTIDFIDKFSPRR